MLPFGTDPRSVGVEGAYDSLFYCPNCDYVAWEGRGRPFSYLPPTKRDRELIAKFDKIEC